MNDLKAHTRSGHDGWLRDILRIILALQLAFNTISTIDITKRLA